MRHPRASGGLIRLLYQGIAIGVGAIVFASPILLAAVDVLRPADRIRADVSKHPCHEQIEQTLKDWNTQGVWIEQFSFTPGEKLFRSPTDRVGKWVQLKLLPKSEIELLNFTDRNAVEMKYGLRTCVPKSSVLLSQAESIFPGQKTMGGFSVFRDSDLENLLRTKKRGVLFVWNPYDASAVEALMQAKAAARMAKLDFVTLVDPSADPQSVAHVARTIGLNQNQVQYLDSFDLGLRNIHAHTPSYILFANGKVEPSIHRGYETTQRYMESFSSLK